jgi:hypothetical protein
MFREPRAAMQAAATFSASRNMRSLISVLLLFACVLFQGLTPPMSAQTMLTGTQIRNPLTPVSVLPSTCTPYSIFFLTTTQTPYICSTINTLTPLLAGQTGDPTLPSMTGIPGYLYTDGTHMSWGDMVSGGSGALDCSTMPGQCDIVTSIVPRLTSANTWTGVNDFSGAAWTKPFMSASSAPASPQEGQTYYDTTTHSPFYYNGSAFTSFGGGGGGTAVVNSSGTLSNAKVFVFSATIAGYAGGTVSVPSGTFTSQPVCMVGVGGGDLSGTAPGICQSTSATCSTATTANTISIGSAGGPGTYTGICVGN